MLFIADAPWSAKQLFAKIICCFLGICSEISLQNITVYVICYSRGTGIRGLMRGMATLPQGNQELLVVRDKVGRLQVSLG